MWSVLRPGSHIVPHCGPTNARLRVHLGLKVIFIFLEQPKHNLIQIKVSDNCTLRVGDSHVKWENGEVLIFDDSFEHEVWNYSQDERLIFIMDIFHPDLNENNKK